MDDCLPEIGRTEGTQLMSSHGMYVQSGLQPSPAPKSQTDSALTVQTAATQAALTLFAIPKPFTDPQMIAIQANAIRSWQRLGSPLEILLLGDEPGIAEYAHQLGVRHIPRIRRNANGTPSVGDAFRIAAQAANSPWLMYCNADVILRGDILTLLNGLQGALGDEPCLGFGRRKDIQPPGPLDWSATEWPAKLDCLAATARKASIVCKEYFLFRRSALLDIPDFAVGRGNWDNWLVSACRRRGWKVFRLDSCLAAIHQMHAYTHTGLSRFACYVSGPEAKENERLAGGKHLIAGSVADWIWAAGRLNKASWPVTQFWLDLPRFLRFVLRLPFER